MDYKNLTEEQLPKEFQDMIERFNRLFSKGAGHSFEEEDDLYQYKMDVLHKPSHLVNTLRISHSRK